MKSILQDDTARCFLCGRRGPLDEHHVFGGPLRKASTKYGLTVFLCHDSCHIFGEKSVHKNHDVDSTLKEYAQRMAMEEYGWSVSDFRTHFRKNYIKGDSDELD